MQTPRHLGYADGSHIWESLWLFSIRPEEAELDDLVEVEILTNDDAESVEE